MLVKRKNPLASAPPRCAEGGLTLPELLITITIVGVLAAFAFPAMSGFIAGQRVKTASYDLFATFMFARSEAIKRSADVVVTATSGNWANGWSVTTGSTTLATQEAYSALTMTGTSTSLTYRYNGRPSASAAQNFQISSFRGTSVDGTRCLSISLAGMPTTKLGACS